MTNSQPSVPASLDVLTTSRSDFDLSRLKLFSEATQSIWISAFDLSDWQFDSLVEQEAIREFLGASPVNTLQVLLGNDRFLATRAARFARTRELFSAQIECRLAEGRFALVKGSEELVIVDSRHYLRRVAPPRYRVRMVLDAPERCQALLSDYRRLWEQAAPCLPATPLGL